jgi:putative phage-type endonuclease
MSNSDMLIQGSPEWFAFRLGKVSASRVSDLMAKTKSGYSASRKNYMSELICQRLTGSREEGFASAAMQRGTEMEPIARSRYENETDTRVFETGCIAHPNIEDFVASPDGLVGFDGSIEIKCPNTATHIEFIKSGKIPANYQKQMTAQMLCAERSWTDFVMFDDRLPHHLSYKCIRFDLDSKMADEMEGEIKNFLIELNETIETLENIK